MKTVYSKVSNWLDTYEDTCRYNLAESYCEPISINTLVSLSTTPFDPLLLLSPSSAQAYNDIRGNPDLLSNISAVYSSAQLPDSVSDSTPLERLPPENILITQGAIAANFIVLFSLLGPGDHVICLHPTYHQLLSVPQTLGAKVDLWKTNPEHGWVPDIEELKALVQPSTKLIVICNPNNPTGAVIPTALLKSIISVARAHSIPILSDEVYRPLFHSLPSPATPPPSLLSLGYEYSITTGSLSKAFSLAGIRTGWIASRSTELIERFAATRGATSICVSQVDQIIAATALSSNVRPNLLERNLKLVRTNIALLDAFIHKHREKCDWVPPVAGTTAYVRFHRSGIPLDATSLCKMVIEKTGVLLLPADQGFGGDFSGYVRIGYCAETETVRKGCEALDRFMNEWFDTVPPS